MQKNKASNMMKGIGIGMAIGGVSAAMGSCCMKSGSCMKNGKKSASKAIKAVGDVIDNIQFMMK